MKNKIILVIVSAYIFLILIILGIGLKVQETEQLLVIGTGTAAGTITRQTVEDEFQFSETAIDNTGTYTRTVTPSAAFETSLPPSPEPTNTPTTSLVSQEPTQSTPSEPTSTQINYPIAGEETEIPTSTPPAYPIQDNTTPTFTATPTTQTGCDGEWVVYSEQPDGSFLSGLMNVSIEGSDLSAEVSLGEETIVFEGILNESQIIAVGSWFGSGRSGNFYWRTNALEQFVGNLDREFGFCGARAENNMPDPCLEAPTNK
jgi:hypothetical protein